MRTSSMIAILLLALGSLLFAQTNPIVSYAYVGTRSKKIYAYGVHQNGSSTALSGSPFSGPGAYIANTTNFLFATDGTNIASYQRSSTGSIHQVATINGVAHNDTPDESGVGFLTLDRTGATLYAGEQDFQGPSNNAYAEFTKRSNGSLAFLANTPINVNYGGPLTFTTGNTLAYGTGCSMATWSVFAFHRSSTGTLTPFDPGTTIPPNTTQDLCPAAMASSARGYVAVAYFTVGGLTPVWRIAIYKVTSSGALQFISSVGTSFSTIRSIRFESTGNYLAVGGNGIAVYRLNSNATLTKTGGRSYPSATFFGIQWDHSWHILANSSAHFWVFNGRLGALSLAGSTHSVTNSTNVAVVPLL
jgi:6-phosphogluconolactonase (cycloisomerase 2 family)